MLKKNNAKVLRKGLTFTQSYVAKVCAKLNITTLFLKPHNYYHTRNIFAYTSARKIFEYTKVSQVYR